MLDGRHSCSGVALSMVQDRLSDVIGAAISPHQFHVDRLDKIPPQELLAVFPALANQRQARSASPSFAADCRLGISFRYLPLKKGD